MDQWQVKVVLVAPDGVWHTSSTDTLENLTDDEAQMVAANLAYGLVESAWGWVVKNEED